MCPSARLAHPALPTRLAPQRDPQLRARGLAPGGGGAAAKAAQPSGSGAELPTDTCFTVKQIKGFNVKSNVPMTQNIRNLKVSQD